MRQDSFYVSLPCSWRAFPQGVAQQCTALVTAIYKIAAAAQDALTCMSQLHISAQLAQPQHSVRCLLGLLNHAARCSMHLTTESSHSRSMAGNGGLPQFRQFGHSALPRLVSSQLVRPHL